MGMFKDIESQSTLAYMTDATVLITGETGTGKTTLARTIHQRSRYRSGPFVVVNLATLHEGTFEAELFGYEKGAFTGADQSRMGQLERAQGGTVFLDEVTELPLRLQARLLEFLNSKTIRRLGGSQDLRLNVRVIAATNRGLQEAIEKKEFREDLFHRLHVIPVELKPLRHRTEELDEIIHACLQDVAAEKGRSIHRISSEVALLFETYPWPGNFRELKNVLEYAVAAVDGTEIKKSHLPRHLLSPDRPLRLKSQLLECSNQLGQMELPLSLDYRKTLATFEKAYFELILSRNLGRVGRSARQIGLNKATLARRIRTYGLNSGPLRS